MKRKSKIMVMCLCVGLFISLLSGCDNRPTLKIGFLNNHNEGSEAWNSYEKKIEKQEKFANDVLEERGIEYRVNFEVISSLSPIDSYDEFDLIEGPRVFTLKELKTHFRDLTSDLERGDLKSVYESMPPVFWDTVSLDGRVYSISRYIPNTTHCLRIPEVILDDNSIRGLNQLSGKRIEAWDSYFADLFAQNGNLPFIQNPFSNTFFSPILSGNAWETHFLLLSSCIGISYDAPKEGVVCIYESVYGEKMKTIWQEYNKKGYIISEADITEEDKIWYQEHSINFGSGYDITIQKENGLIICPLQDVIYNTPMSSCIKQYWQLIPKGGEHFEEMCSFLSDISTDEELLTSICLNEENIPIIYLTEAASNLGDAGIDLLGEFEENRIRHQERLDNIVNTEISDFCFDSTNVKEQVEAVERVIEDYKVVFSAMLDTRNWEMWDEYMDQLIQDLYNAGMQEILDEANMQYEKYCDEK